MIPHETPIPGPANDFALALSARVPVLETARTRLRGPRLTDLPFWTEVLCGPTSEMLGGPFTRNESFTEFSAAVGLWLLRGHGPWTVEDRATGEVLGFVMLGFEAGDQEPELGYLFREGARGRGLATEAVLAARAHARALGLPSLVSYISPGNARSIALARRIGASEAGEFSGCAVWRHPMQGVPA